VVVHLLVSGRWFLDRKVSIRKFRSFTTGSLSFANDYIMDSIIVKGTPVKRRANMGFRMDDDGE